MGLGDAFDWLASTLVISSLIVGFWEASAELGPVSSIIERAINDPSSFGKGALVFFMGLDVWTPAIPLALLPPWLRWVGFFYPFAEGFVPHFSLSTCLVALVVSIIVTWIVLHVSDLDFWWGGLGVAVAVFAAAWYGFTLLAWQLMFWGGAHMGLTQEQVFSIWLNAVQATAPPLLQLFFLTSIPVSFGWLLRKTPWVG